MALAPGPPPCTRPCWNMHAFICSINCVVLHAVSPSAGVSALESGHSQRYQERQHSAGDGWLGQTQWVGLLIFVSGCKTFRAVLGFKLYVNLGLNCCLNYCISYPWLWQWFKVSMTMMFSFVQRLLSGFMFFISRGSESPDYASAAMLSVYLTAAGLTISLSLFLSVSWFRLLRSDHSWTEQAEHHGWDTILDGPGGGDPQGLRAQSGHLVPGHHGYRDDRGRAAVPQRKPSEGENKDF